MTFRGTFSRGVIILNDSTGLHEGDPVRVVADSSATKKSNGKRPKAKTSSSRLRSSKESLPLPGFGAWRGRSDVQDGTAFIRGNRARRAGRLSS